MATKKQKTPARGLSATDKAEQAAFALSVYNSPQLPPCQALTLERRLKVAGLAQDLGLFCYERSLALIDEPDEVFNGPFATFARCVSVVEAHLAQVQVAL